MDTSGWGFGGYRGRWLRLATAGVGGGTAPDLSPKPTARAAPPRQKQCHNARIVSRRSKLEEEKSIGR